LRVPPYPITTKWDVPAANTAYSVYVEDLVDHSSETSTLTSDANKQISYILPRSKVQYDRDFLFQVKDSAGEIVVDENLTIYRPYVNPNTLATTANEIAEYKKWEIIARSIMDNYLDKSDFYNHKLVIVKEGQGGDYFPIWHNVNKVLKVYENNVLIFNGEDVAITIATQTPTISSGTVTLTTATAHGFEVGDLVTIAGINSTFNGSYYITEVPSTTTFIYGRDEDQRVDDIAYGADTGTATVTNETRDTLTLSVTYDEAYNYVGFLDPGTWDLYADRTVGASTETVYIGSGNLTLRLANNPVPTYTIGN
jgi:hypothetical protein